MAYTKQNFEDGQKLKAEHLNKIETGLTDIWSNMQGISNDHREDIAQIQKDVTELENISKDHQEMLNDFNQDISFTLNMSQDHNVAIDKLNTDSAFLMDKSQDHDQVINDNKIRLNFAEQDIERVDTEITKLKEIVETVEVPVNINDEVYEYGRFDSKGAEIENGQVTGLRTASYLPVIGGKTIEVIYGQNPFSESDAAQIVQYNSEREVIVGRTEVRPKMFNGSETSDSTISKQLTLNDETAYIRASFSHWRNNVTLDNCQISIVYLDDNVSGYIDQTVTKEKVFVNRESQIIYEFDNVELMKSCQFLKPGDYCETKGYRSFGDGGRARYKIVSEADDSTHQEVVSKGVYASLLNDGVINVKQLGAYGDDTHNDAKAIQKAFNLATNGVVIPPGTYLIGETISIKNKTMFSLNAENSIIKHYAGSGYAFQISGVYYSKLRFGTVRNISVDAEGCLDFYSGGAEAGYIDVHFRLLRSHKNCVYVHSDTGYINEVRFLDGHVEGYDSNESVGFKFEAQSANVLMDGYRLQNIGFERIHTGVYAIGYPGLLEGNSVYGVMNNINIIDCRCEQITTAIKTENKVIRICARNLGPATNPEYYDFSEETYECEIDVPILDVYDGSCVAFKATVSGGVIVPNVQNRSLFCHAEEDLTQTNDVNSAYNIFHIYEYTESLKLSRVYGRKFGLNKFKINMLGKNASGFVIYDSDGNTLCDGASLSAGDVVEFEWYGGNADYAEGWIATKLNTIPIIST